jgi:hypothetical protein
MAITLANLVPRVRRLLEDEPAEDRLGKAISDTTSETAVVGNPTLWAENSIIEFDDASGEQARTRGTPTGNTLDIKRGHNNTTAATHLDGAVLLKDPRFAYDNIIEAMTRTVNDDFFPWIWDTATDTITYDSTKNLYNAATDFIDLIAAVQKSTSTVTDQHRYGTGYPAKAIHVERDVDTTIAASGVAYRFPHGFYNTTNTVKVKYRRLYTTSTIPDDWIADALVYGACARLLRAKAAPITGMERPANESAETHADLLRVASFFQRDFEDKRHRISNDLKSREPPARVWMG